MTTTQRRARRVSTSLAILAGLTLAACGGSDSSGPNGPDDGLSPGEGVAISVGGVVLLRQILDGALSFALDQPTTAATWEVDHLAGLAMEHHLERRLKALRLIGHN